MSHQMMQTATVDPKHTITWGDKPKEHSNALGATATALAGTALAAAISNGNGFLGGLFGGDRQGAHQVENNQIIALAAENGMLKAENYTDRAVLEAYKSTDTKVTGINDALARLYVAQGRSEEREACTSRRLDSAELKIAELEREQCNNRVNIATINGSITALAADTKAGLALEAERRACGDATLREYVTSHYVPGTLLIPEDRVYND